MEHNGVYKTVPCESARCAENGECGRKKKVIVTMTSWRNRIFSVHAVISSILSNMRAPDVVVLNLSIVEFPHKENSIPHDLVELKNQGKIILNFCEGNQKAFKKLGPSLKMFGDEIYIVADDDIIYPSTFVGDMLNTFFDNGCAFAITSYPTDEHCAGCGTLFTGEMLSGFYEKLNDEIINTNEDDLFYTYLVNENGYQFKSCKKMSGLSKLQFDNVPNGMSYRKAYNSIHTVQVLNKYFRFQKTSIHGIRVPSVNGEVVKQIKPLPSLVPVIKTPAPLATLKGWKPAGYGHF